MSFNLIYNKILFFHPELKIDNSLPKCTDCYPKINLENLNNLCWITDKKL